MMGHRSDDFRILQTVSQGRGPCWCSIPGRAPRVRGTRRAAASAASRATSGAALAQLPSGKLHPHQYRVPKAALRERRRRLLRELAVLRRAESFEALFGLVDRLSGPIARIGELAVRSRHDEDPGDRA
jgi:hypothetical protein